MNEHFWNKKEKIIEKIQTKLVQILSLGVHQISLYETRFVYYFFEHTVCDLLNRGICNKGNHYLTHMQTVFQSIDHVVWNQKLWKDRLIPLLENIII